MIKSEQPVIWRNGSETASVFHDFISKRSDRTMKEKVIVASRLCRQFEIDDVIVEAVKNLELTVQEGEFISMGLRVQERQPSLI